MIAVRRILALSVLTALFVSCSGSTPPPATGSIATTPYPGHSLVWSDEFDADSLDETHWNYLLGTGYNNDGSGWGNNELQYYRRENTRLADGKLIITARKENYENRSYTSSRLTTDDKQEITFGRIDVRAKLPIGQGIWPAVWMLGADFPATQGWPAAGEIDIMEYLGHKPNTLYGTVHYGRDYLENRRYRGDSTRIEGSEPFHTQYHTFSIDWRRDTIDWLLDGERYHRFTAAEAQRSGQPYPFNAPQYLLINLAVGGNWPGSPDSTTQFPQELLVDYVRMYGLKE